MRYLVLAAALFFESAAISQTSAPQPRPPQPRDTLTSGEVHPDRTVTFRLRAPKAREVNLRGEWLGGQTSKMTQDEKGVWSVTVGPLPPNIYSYSFSVDGLSIVDPKNPKVKLGIGAPGSVIEVPGEKPQMWEVRDVPHGAVQVQWYKSASVGSTRRVYVYTPPGYDPAAATRYPVLWLLHGSGDTEAEWTMAGRANMILDNVLAEGKAKPMIVAMPFGHVTAVEDYSPEARARRTKLFEDDLLQDVMPLIDAKYRTAAGPKNRAIAGLSMGGAQALNIGLSHLDLFGGIGVFSASGGADFESRYEKLLADANGTNAKLNLFWIGCGDKDPGFAAAKKTSEVLKEHGIRHVFREIEGAHTWMVWRQFLSELSPLLFQSS